MVWRQAELQRPLSALTQVLEGLAALVIHHSLTWEAQAQALQEGTWAVYRGSSRRPEIPVPKAFPIKHREIRVSFS